MNLDMDGLTRPHFNAKMHPLSEAPLTWISLPPYKNRGEKAIKTQFSDSLSTFSMSRTGSVIEHQTWGCW